MHLYRLGELTLYSLTDICVHNKRVLARNIETAYRYIMTLWVCPILWAREKACMSLCGFQSESYIMTVSADARLIPSPPARVLSRNTNSSEPGSKNRIV